jgi:hypothetical protein
LAKPGPIAQLFNALNDLFVIFPRDMARTNDPDHVAITQFFSQHLYFSFVLYTLNIESRSPGKHDFSTCDPGCKMLDNK